MDQPAKSRCQRAYGQNLEPKGLRFARENRVQAEAVTPLVSPISYRMNTMISYEDWCGQGRASQS